MIHRQNYHDVRAYLRHIERVRQNDEKTIKRARAHLRHLLEWADSTPLPKARAIDPTFPAYLLTARADGKDQTLAPASIAKCLTNARQFFAFARAEWTLRYKRISESWIEGLQPPRAVRIESRLTVREFWTLDDVRAVARVSAETLREHRAQAAVSVLFLSGMRADALATLPIHCVRLAQQAIHQLPEHGVRTKNRKAAITYLLNIPDLFTYVQRWDALLRSFNLPPASLWYASLSTDGMALRHSTSAPLGRSNLINDDLRLICAKAGVPYLSPHKLRHGHTVYALKRAQNMEQLKAISQNIMHASVVTTDKTYGNLLTNEVHQIIARL